MECRVAKTLEFSEYYPYYCKLYIRDFKFIYCMKNNDNDLCHGSCFEYGSNNANSIF